MISMQLELTAQQERWQRFYERVFRLQDLRCGALFAPPALPGFDRLMVIPSALDLDTVILVCRPFFDYYSVFRDLGRTFGLNDCRKTSDYAIWVRDQVEADQEMRMFSVDRLKGIGVQGMSILERLLLELYYLESEKLGHLDLRSVTLCSASRIGDSVPGVCWDSKAQRLCIGIYNAMIAEPNLRVRQVVAADAIKYEPDESVGLILLRIVATMDQYRGLQIVLALRGHQ